jgi:hypothetical protein
MKLHKKGEVMQTEDYEALEDRLDELFEDVRRSRQALEWLEDHCPDDHLASNMMHIRVGLGLIENKIHVLLGRPLHQASPALAENVPFD